VNVLKKRGKRSSKRCLKPTESSTRKKRPKDLQSLNKRKNVLLKKLKKLRKRLNWLGTKSKDLNVRQLKSLEPNVTLPNLQESKNNWHTKKSNEMKQRKLKGSD